MPEVFKLPPNKEKDLLENYILKPANDAVADRRSSGFDNYQEEWIKRFEALRSTSSLDRDIKTWPWYGAANIGIPLEATAVFAMLARIIRAEFGIFPSVIAKGVGTSDIESEGAMSDYVNWLLFEKMRVLLDKYLAFQDSLIRGDTIIKTVHEERIVEFEEDTFYLVNSLGEPFLNQIDRLPLEVEENTPPKTDPMTGETFVPVPSKAMRKTVIYSGPRMVNPPLPQFIVPREAEHPDINQLDWIIHEYWKPISYFIEKARQGLINQDELSKMVKKKDETRPRPAEGQVPLTLGLSPAERTKRFMVWEWHGTYEDEKGRPTEIIALADPKEKVLLGYIKNEFFMRTGRRQFVHYQPFPRNGTFYAPGVGQMLRGIRNMLDAMINQGLDRGSINNNPPTLYDRNNSGYNPAEHKFGPGLNWGLDNISLVAPYPINVSEQNALIREEQLFSLVQKLLGINDFSLGVRSTPGVGGANAANQTATGIGLITQEANIRFDMIIRLFQDYSNPELVTQIVKHIALNMDKNQKEIFRVTEGKDPFRSITGEEISRNYNFYFLGNISTINQAQIRQDAMTLYQVYVNGNNPFVVQDSEIFRKLSQKPLDAFGYKDIKLKSKEELQKIALMDRLKQMRMAQLASGGGSPVNRLQGVLQ